MLNEFGCDIWTTDGPVVTAALGFDYPTRMIVIRLTGGALFIWSPVLLTPDLRAEVDMLGTVRHLIAPNIFHHQFLADWLRAYPDALAYAAPGLREKCRDIAFDDDLGVSPAPIWSEEIEQQVMRGNALLSEVVFFHAKSRTVIFTDLLQQFPTGWFSGWRALLAKWDLMLRPAPSVPRKFRVAFTDRRAARASLDRILAWPAEKVLMAHGVPVTKDGQAFLQDAFNWLAA